MLLEERSEMVRRLHITEGHVHAIAAMVEGGQTCEQVLHQLGAVRAALREISAWLLICQVEQSREIIVQSSCPEEQQVELTRLGNLFQIMNQYSISHGEFPDE